MNILLKNHDLPNCCANCYCSENERVYYCQVLRKGMTEVEYWDERPDKCPLELVDDKTWDEYKALSQTTRNLLLKSLNKVVEMLESEYFIKCVLDEVARRGGNEEF